MSIGVLLVLVAITSFGIGMILMDTIRKPKKDAPDSWPTITTSSPELPRPSAPPPPSSVAMGAVSTIHLFERQNEMEKRLTYLEKVVAKHVG